MVDVGGGREGGRRGRMETILDGKKVGQRGVNIVKRGGGGVVLYVAFY